MNALQKYLDRHAEPEMRELHNWPHDTRFDQVVVIPAYDETPQFIERLTEQFFNRQRLLAIVVVNRPDNVAHCPANTELLLALQHRSPSSWRSRDGTMALRPEGKSAILCVDRHQRPIPARQGVGLARKLGTDIACALIHRGHIGERWIHSTDADALLPQDYFTATQSLDNTATAGYFDFSHIDDGSDIAQATAFYERHLRHYRDGLKFAGSPYAFFTIGSTLVFDHVAYASARGFPKRCGGEDFYLLNKLAKLGGVRELAPQIRIFPRLSQRVPFGTGPASARILQSLQRDEPVRSYHPQIFMHLREFLQLAERLLANSSARTLHLGDTQLQDLHPAVFHALRSLGFQSCEKHLNQSKDTNWRRHHFHAWFDAFRTLKFVHHLERDGGFSPQPLKR